MGSKYEWNINPFRDFLFSSIMHGVDITDKEFEVEIYVAFSAMLEYFVDELNNEYLDYNIKKNDGKFKVVGNNLITSLWLSGIFPDKPNDVINKKEYVIENVKYKFNEKTKKLTHRLIKK